MFENILGLILDDVFGSRAASMAGTQPPSIPTIPRPYIIEDLEIVKSFGLIDIYKKNPCQNEFIELMESEKGFPTDGKWETIHTVKKNLTLMRNLHWLVAKGFLREKVKIKRENKPLGKIIEV